MRKSEREAAEAMRAAKELERKARHEAWVREMREQAKGPRPKLVDKESWKRWKAMPLDKRTEYCISGDSLGISGWEMWSGRVLPP